MHERLQMTLLAFMLSIACCSVGETADWVLYARDGEKNEEFSYDRESLIRSGNVMRVWSQRAGIPFSVPDPAPSYWDEKMKAFAEREGKKRITKERVLFELNCGGREARVLQYQSEDDFKSYFSAKWDSIPPESLLDALYKAVCPKESRN